MAKYTPNKLTDLTDTNLATGAGTDGYAVTWDDGTGLFTLSQAGGSSAPQSYGVASSTSSTLGTAGTTVSGLSIASVPAGTYLATATMQITFAQAASSYAIYFFGYSSSSWLGTITADNGQWVAVDTGSHDHGGTSATVTVNMWPPTSFKRSYAMQGVLTLTGTGTIEVRSVRGSGTGAATVFDRSLSLVAVSP